jgi:hypothetical protein
MTARIINLADHRRAREQARFDQLMWPFTASIGFWEAYLAALQTFQQAAARGLMPCGIDDLKL